MSRTKGILAAGTLTGLVLITILALGFGSLQAQASGDALALPATGVGGQPPDGLINEDTLQAWQEYSAQLEQTVRVLQVRDADYQRQLAEANQTILQLQDRINNSPAPPFFGEREEHEHEEHNVFDFGEFDD